VIPTAAFHAVRAGRAKVPMMTSRAGLATAPIAQLGTATCAVRAATPIASLGIAEAKRTMVPTTATCAVLAATMVDVCSSTQPAGSTQKWLHLRLHYLHARLALLRILYRNR